MCVGVWGVCVGRGACVCVCACVCECVLGMDLPWTGDTSISKPPHGHIAVNGWKLDSYGQRPAANSLSVFSDS